MGEPSTCNPNRRGSRAQPGAYSARCSLRILGLTFLVGLVVVVIPMSLDARRGEAAGMLGPQPALQGALTPVGELLARADEVGLRAINGWAGQSELMDGLIGRLNEDDAYTVPVALLVTWLWFLLLRPGLGRGSRERAVLILAGMLVAIVVARTLTRVWPYPRPLMTEPWVHVVPDWGTEGIPPGFAYPSDHAALLVSLAVTILVWNWRQGILVLAAALLMTLPRVYIG